MAFPTSIAKKANNFLVNFPMNGFLGTHKSNDLIINLTI